MIGDSSKDNTRVKMDEFCARLQKVCVVCAKLYSLPVDIQECILAATAVPWQQSHD